MRRRGVMAGIAVCAALAVGAGTAWAGGLTKREWRREANGICEAAEEEIAEIREDIAGDSDEQLEQYVDEAVPVYEDALDELEDLDEPASLRKSVRRFLSLTRDAIEELADNPTLLRGEGEDPFEASAESARKLGIDACA